MDTKNISIVDGRIFPVCLVEHEFRYTFNEPMQVSDLIMSLKAYETLTTSYLPKILNELFAVKVEKIQVAVSEIERGSFLEKLIFKLCFKDEAAFDDFCLKMRRFLGTESTDGNINMSRIIMYAMTALLGVGVGYLLFKSPAKTQEAVTNNIITIINNANNDGLDGEHIVEVVKAATGAYKQKTAENVAKVYLPANKYQGSVTLAANGEKVEPVQQEIVATLPKDVDLRDTPLTEDYKDIDVQIRATDRDKNTGWHAIIEQIVPSRVRLELPGDIDLNRLANNATIRANVTVEYELRPNGSRKPKKIILNSLTSD